MNIEECGHEWDFSVNEYLPVSLSTRKHHPCKGCGLIDFKLPSSHLKTGKLIALIKVMFENYGIKRSGIKQYTDEIKEMKRNCMDDNSIIEIILSKALHENGHIMDGGEIHG